MSNNKKRILSKVIAERMADHLVDKYIDSLTLTEESAYHVFFKKMMHQHGMKSLKGASKDKKASFFSDVRRRWHAISGKIGRRKIYENVDPDRIRGMMDDLKRRLPNASPEMREQITSRLGKLGSMLRAGLIQSARH